MCEQHRAFEFIVNAGASRQEFAPTASQAREDRMYYNAEARIVWRGRSRWQIDLAYRYRRQEFDDPEDVVAEDTDNSPESNAVWLTMRYTWARIGLFR